MDCIETEGTAEGSSTVQLVWGPGCGLVREVHTRLLGLTPFVLARYASVTPGPSFGSSSPNTMPWSKASCHNAVWELHCEQR